MRFIHASDIHLDSPLRGLDSYPGAPVERLRIATRQAFERLIDLCLEERVDFLVVAGDLFDTDVKDFNAALTAAAQLRRLKSAGIPVYLILGNHDSREEVTRHVPWPDNVTLFDHLRPNTVRHPTLPVALHGMSYPKREVLENLVPKYPAPVAGYVNIGLLHTNAGGNTRHAAYAPCAVEELAQKGYHYWALGHVHEHTVLNVQPHIVYPGNTQGRHVRETGRKGCVLVTIDLDGDEHVVSNFEFRETGVVRWFRETIDLRSSDDEEALLHATQRRLREVVTAAAGKLAAVRLEYTGRCAVHAALSDDTAIQQLDANIRAQAADAGDDVWIEKIKFRTQPTFDLAVLRQRHDLLGSLLRDVEALVMDPGSLLELPETQDLITKLGANPVSGDEEGIDFADRERHALWVRGAEILLVNRLLHDDGNCA